MTGMDHTVPMEMGCNWNGKRIRIHKLANAVSQSGYNVRDALDNQYAGTLDVALS